MDGSNGYERVAPQFLKGRGRPSFPPAGVGVATVRRWARTLEPGATVIDLGCGSGFPLTAVLIAEGLDVYAIDAAPSLVKAFQHNFPSVPVACETVEESAFFELTFDAALAWGLIFLLSEEAQQRFLSRIAGILSPRGTLLFTTCGSVERLEWADAMTGLASLSLSREQYRGLLLQTGLPVMDEYDDEGQNHYFEAVKGA